jgi:hypothetical protein
MLKRDTSELSLEFAEMVDFLNEIADLDGVNLQELSAINPMLSNYVWAYFNDTVSDKARLLDASKNVAMNALYSISKDIKNLQSSNRGVDMNDPKDGAKKSPKAWRAQQMSMDSYSTLPLMKEENGAGKDVIGIAAVGIKTFCGLSHMYNQEISNFEGELQKEFGAYTDEQIEQLWTSDEFLQQRVTGWLENLCHPNTYDFYNEKTGERKTVITTLLANINLNGKKFMNLAYDSLIQKLRDQHDQNLKLQAEGKLISQTVSQHRTTDKKSSTKTYNDKFSNTGYTGKLTFADFSNP